MKGNFYFGILLLLSLISVNANSTTHFQNIMLVRNFDVLVNCTVGTIGKADQGFSGIDIDYFTQIANASGLDYNSWAFQCTDIESLYDLIQSNTSLYLGGMGGLQISYDQMQSGFIYSQPTFKTGLSILVSNETDNWVFLKIFEIKFGLLLIATAFMTGILLFILEKRKEALEKYLWHTFSALYFCNAVKLNNSTSRMVMIAYWFMVLITISTYTAQMTNIMSISEILNGINSASGLNQKTIMTFTGYEFLLYPYGAKPVTTMFPTSLDNVLSDFSQNNVDGYVLDDVISRSYAFQSCDINIVARLFQPFSYAIIFSTAQNQTLIDNLNQAILAYNQNISFSNLIDQYLLANPNYNQCIQVNNDSSGKITISDVQGLWIIMGISLAFSTLLYLVSKIKCYKRFRKILDKCRITDPSQENEEGMKYGDDLIVENLRDVTYKLMRNMETTINERLVEMDDKVAKFYELLLSGENDDSNSDIDHNDHDHDHDHDHDNEEMNKINHHDLTDVRENLYGAAVKPPTIIKDSKSSSSNSDSNPQGSISPTMPLAVKNLEMSNSNNNNINNDHDHENKVDPKEEYNEEKDILSSNCRTKLNLLQVNYVNPKENGEDNNMEDSSFLAYKAENQLGNIINDGEEEEDESCNFFANEEEEEIRPGGYDDIDSAGGVGGTGGELNVLNIDDLNSVKKSVESNINALNNMNIHKDTMRRGSIRKNKIHEGNENLNLDKLPTSNHHHPPSHH